MKLRTVKATYMHINQLYILAYFRITNNKFKAALTVLRSAYIAKTSLVPRLSGESLGMRLTKTNGERLYSLYTHTSVLGVRIRSVCLMCISITFELTRTHHC